jgi:hypothetical protein
MNKLIVGLGLGEGVNQTLLQEIAKGNNYKYIKIGNIDDAHKATVNNLNQAEYWARVYAEAFESVRNGQNVVIDMDYYDYVDISELVVLAKDNGVLHIQGVLPKLENSLDLLGGERTVVRVLENEKLPINGLDSLYVKDINVEIIKNISSVSPKFAESLNAKVIENGTDAHFDNLVKGAGNSSFLEKYWDTIVMVGYGLLGAIVLGLLYFGGVMFWNKWKSPDEVKVIYTGPKEVVAETSYVNTNQPLFIEDATTTETIVEEVATITEVVATETVEEVATITTNVEKTITKPAVKKYGRINPEVLAVPYCCTDGTFRQWYKYLGDLNGPNFSGDIYYVKTNENVYVISNAVMDNKGRIIGGNAYRIPGADVSTFVILNDYLQVHNFARDNNNVYYKGQAMTGMDPFLTMLYCPAGTLQSCFFNDGLYYYSMIGGKIFTNSKIQNSLR